MLVAGLTLLPALLSILGRAVFWPAKIVPGEAHDSWWGKVAPRVVARPPRTLGIGVVVFGALAFGIAVLLAGRIRWGDGCSERDRRGCRQRHACRVLPSGELEPDEPHLAARHSGLERSWRRRHGESATSCHRAFQLLAGPARSRRSCDPPATYVRLHRVLGRPGLLPPLPAVGTPAGEGTDGAL